MIAGGRGFLGTALAASLVDDGHSIFILTRRKPDEPNQYLWDGVTPNGWAHLVGEMDAVVNFSGYSTSHWPWTNATKKRFLDSRVLPGRAFVSAIASATRRPRVYLQASGINYYGLHGKVIADESSPPADDFLAQLTVQWEEATKPLDELGVRRVVMRSAVVLAKRGGLFPLMALPVRLFFGGKFGSGEQAMPWIHIADYIDAVKFLLENENARGAFNLISPEQSSNAVFMREACKAFSRPYWFHLPVFLLRILLGEMSVLLIHGRFSRPQRLLDMGFDFQYKSLPSALQNLLQN
ncbi:MAG: TIGR01777 family oxidoreductase [Chloroflexota bacterium]